MHFCPEIRFSVFGYRVPDARKKSWTKIGGTRRWNDGLVENSVAEKNVMVASTGEQDTGLTAFTAADTSGGRCFADGHPGAIIAASGMLKDRHLLIHEDDCQHEITLQLQR